MPILYDPRRTWVLNDLGALQWVALHQQVANLRAEVNALKTAVWQLQMQAQTAKTASQLR